MSEIERDFLIWSYEHDAWWGPAKMGYTKDFERAGRYTKDEAARICEDANRYSAEINECMVHFSEVGNFLHQRTDTT
jgi:hypothetical protein